MLDSKDRQAEVLFKRWRNGDSHAWDILHAMMRKWLRKRTLFLFAKWPDDERFLIQGLVELTFEDWVHAGRVDAIQRNHFAALCAHMMRRILVQISRETSVDVG